MPTYHQRVGAEAALELLDGSERAGQLYVGIVWPVWWAGRAPSRVSGSNYWARGRCAGMLLRFLAQTSPSPRLVIVASADPQPCTLA